MRTTATRGRPRETQASTGAIVFLALAFFLLSADLLHFVVAGAKIKFGYFALAAMWATAPGAMRAAALDALRRAPRRPLLLLVPLAISVATSAAPARSLAWTLWIAFDAFTVVTVYAYLMAHRFRPQQVAGAAAIGLALIAAGGLAQFVSIYFVDRIVLSPQQHLELYRINGLSGWPHFLCIFSFLLLPLVMTQERLSIAVRAVLVVLMFVLVQSTAKTGWVLFLALGSLLLWFDRATFTRNFLLFLLPVTIGALALPTPTPADPAAPAGGSVEMITGSEKLQVFSEDLDLTRATTSGTDRVLINTMGLAVFMQHPWFGVGPRAYARYVDTRFDAELPGANKLDANGNINRKNENIWIEWLAECGIFFTAGVALLVVRALWVPGFAFRTRLHFGTFMALVLYFGLAGQVSQNGLLTLAYAILGVHFYARAQHRVAKSDAFASSRMRLSIEALSPLAATTRSHS